MVVESQSNYHASHTDLTSGHLCAVAQPEGRRRKDQKTKRDSRGEAETGRAIATKERGAEPSQRWRRRASAKAAAEQVSSA